jgi:hypothetical protein
VHPHKQGHDEAKGEQAMKLNIGVPNSMKVAAMVQPWEGKVDGAGVGRLMAAADALGFNKCMLGEHFIIPKEHIALSGDWYFHTVVALGYIGGQTKSLRLSPSCRCKTRLCRPKAGLRLIG